MATKVIVQHRSHSLLEVLAGSVATEPGMRLVGVAHNATEALRLCQREHPDVAVIEADPSGWDAPALAARLRATRLVARVLGLCAPECPCQPISARWVGRGTLVPAAGGVPAVLDAIRLATRQRTILTDRELEVLRLIGAGHTGGEISRVLGISQSTVDNYKRRLFQKLGVQSKAHAVANAARLGLLPPCLARSANVAEPALRHAATRLVLGAPGPLRDGLAAVMARRPPREPAEQADVAVAVLVDPSGEDWQAARELGARIVLVVPDQIDPAISVESVLRGADALLPAAQAPDRLLETVELVAAGHALVDPVLVRTLLDALRLRLADQAAKPLELTPRERQILASIDRGDSVKQTARGLGISIKTVENLQHRLFRKLGVRNRAEAVAAAHSRRLLGIPE